MEWPTDLTLTAQWEENILTASAENKSMPYYTAGTELSVIIEENSGYTIDSYQWYLISDEAGETASEDGEASAASEETGAETASTNSTLFAGLSTTTVRVSSPVRLSANRGSASVLTATLTAQMDTLVASLDSTDGVSSTDGSTDDGTAADDTGDASASDDNTDDAGDGTTVDSTEDASASDESTDAAGEEATTDGSTDGASTTVESTNGASAVINSAGSSSDGTCAASEEDDDSTTDTTNTADTSSATLSGTEVDGATEETYEVPQETAVGEYEYFCRITATSADDETVTVDVPVTLTVTPLVVKSVATPEEAQDLALTYGDELPNLADVEATVKLESETTEASTSGSFTWADTDGVTETGYYSLIFTPDDAENFDYSALTTLYDETTQTWVSGWDETSGTLAITVYVEVTTEYMLYIPYVEADGVVYYTLTDDDGNEIEAGTLDGYSSYLFETDSALYAAAADSAATAQSMTGQSTDSTSQSTSVYAISISGSADSVTLKLTAVSGIDLSNVTGVAAQWASTTEEDGTETSELKSLSTLPLSLSKTEDSITITASFSGLGADTWLALTGIADGRDGYTVAWSNGTSVTYTSFADALDAANTTTYDKDGTTILTATLTVPAGRSISGDVNVNRRTTLVVEKGAVIGDDISVILLGTAALQTADGVDGAALLADTEDVSADATSVSGYTVYTNTSQLTIGAATLTIGDQVLINYAVKSSGTAAKGLVYTTVAADSDGDSEKAALFAALRSPFGSATSREALSTVSVSGYTVLKTYGVKPTEMANTMYTTAYASATENDTTTYSYSQTANYSVKTYAKNMLSSTSNTYLKRLLSAMLNYGAAAETQFLAASTPAATSGVSGLTAAEDTSLDSDSNYPDDYDEVGTSLGDEFSIALALDESVDFVIKYNGTDDSVASVEIDLWDPNEESYVDVETVKASTTYKSEEVWAGGAVPPRNYDNWYLFTVTMESGKSYTAYYSVFSYLSSVDTSTVTTDLINAMAEYCHAAEDYQKAYDTAN